MRVGSTQLVVGESRSPGWDLQGGFSKVVVRRAITAHTSPDLSTTRQAPVTKLLRYLLKRFMSLKAAVNPISIESVAKNAAILANMRHVTALAGGAAAGALRLESLCGFVFYGILSAASLVLFLVVSAGRLPTFFEKPMKALLWDGILAAFPGYVLAWSLVYSLVET